MKLTVNEIADCFAVSPGTIQRWIRQGRIPIRKKGDICLCSESVLKKWARSHNLRYSFTDKDKPCQPDSNVESLLAAINRGGIFYDITGKTMEDVLSNAVACIPDLNADLKKKIFKRLIAREQLMSTGIGKGVAFPHPRTPLSGEELEQSVIITCFLNEPVDYKAVDDIPVFLLFILLSASTKEHLRLLSKLAFCLRDNDFIRFLKTIPAADKLCDRITTFDKQLETAGNY